MSASSPPPPLQRLCIPRPAPRSLRRRSDRMRIYTKQERSEHDTQNKRTHTHSLKGFFEQKAGPRKRLTCLPQNTSRSDWLENYASLQTQHGQLYQPPPPPLHSHRDLAPYAPGANPTLSTQLYKNHFRNEKKYFFAYSVYDSHVKTRKIVCNPDIICVTLRSAIFNDMTWYDMVQTYSSMCTDFVAAHKKKK